MSRFARSTALAVFWIALCAGAWLGAAVPALHAAPDTPVLVTPAQAAERLAHPPAVRILDVRTPEEYAAGHLPGAILLPVDRVDAQAETVLKERSQPTLVYCHSGSRSAVAVATLKRKGYTHLMELKGGIVAWTQAGQPTQKP